ncbi:glycosyltransferase family 4 protein [Salinibacterium sp. SWN1162]|uniref:glycosyltransferase family 4 protein n=1 Tax=Salinibacterium sp. SWN1162 TaxID=2792053 RepID=UPI0018CDAA3E|nr:glycosyltransferase family 4 protein [Salinibacterium sp. SWN1162]MBH0008127.1 glycosyltransferase family 4 protein [Salinibacterium sp. SWN1162]
MVTDEVTAVTFLRGYLGFLKAKGWDVSVVASSTGRLEELARAEGVSSENLPMKRNPAPIRDFLSLLNAVRLLLRLRPKAVVAATPKAGLIGMIAARLTGVPVRIYQIWGLRLETEKGLRRVLFLSLERLAARLATQVVANSQSLADEVRRLGISSTPFVLGSGSSHGVDLRRFDREAGDLRDGNLPTHETLGLSEGEFTVGYVGRVHRDKGLASLLAAVQSLCDTGIKINLLVVGPNEDSSLAHALADANGENLRVASVGPVADTRPYFLLMNVHCLPTRREGFPNVVLEAAALGVATITTSATGARDSVIPEETGLIVSVDDSAELAGALARFATDPQWGVALGESARVNAVLKYDQRTVLALQERNLSQACDFTGSESLNGDRSQEK